jgi:hypothetical protein
MMQHHTVYEIEPKNKPPCIETEKFLQSLIDNVQLYAHFATIAKQHITIHGKGVLWANINALEFMGDKGVKGAIMHYISLTDMEEFIQKPQASTAFKMIYESAVKCDPKRECVIVFTYKEYVMCTRLLLAPTDASRLSQFEVFDKKYVRTVNKKYGCVVCKKTENIKKCSGCGVVYYCSRECQKIHWSLHKDRCNK